MPLFIQRFKNYDQTFEPRPEVIEVMPYDDQGSELDEEAEHRIAKEIETEQEELNEMRPKK